MSPKRIFQVVLIIGLLTSLAISPSNSEPQKNLVIQSSRAAASRGYPTAASLANAVNPKHEKYGFRLTVQSGRNSDRNISEIKSGETIFAEVRQSRVYQAYTGQGQWKGQPQTDLCTVFNTHTEYITLIASAASGIKTIKDLDGRRVVVGRPGSDLQASVVDILAAVGTDYKKDLAAIDARPEAVPDLMQNGGIDAFFWPVEKLSRPLADLMSEAPQIFAVPLAADGIDALVAVNPFYEKTVVPLTINPRLSKTGKIEALGVKMSLIVSCGLPEDTVYRVTKETVEGLITLAKNNPTAPQMTVKAMLAEMPAPVHRGAMRYYRESGLRPSVRP